MNRLSTRNLCVGYNKKVLIGGICIEIGAGEVVSLIGPNGAGKSTVLKSITRQLESLGGAVYVDGEDSAALSHKSFATPFFRRSHRTVKDGPHDLQRDRGGGALSVYGFFRQT